MVDDSMIAVLNIVRGSPPTIITCDIVIGDVQIHGVTFRCGRGQATYINLPRVWSNGHWSPAVTITDADLLDLVRQAVVTSAMEATRYIVS